MIKKSVKGVDIKVGDIVYEKENGDHLKILSLETKLVEGNKVEYHISVGDSRGEFYSAILQNCNVLTYHFLDNSTMAGSIFIKELV